MRITTISTLLLLFVFVFGGCENEKKYVPEAIDGTYYGPYKLYRQNEVILSADYGKITVNQFSDNRLRISVESIEDESYFKFVNTQMLIFSGNSTDLYVEQNVPATIKIGEDSYTEVAVNVVGRLSRSKPKVRNEPALQTVYSDLQIAYKVDEISYKFEIAPYFYK